MAPLHISARLGQTILIMTGTGLIAVEAPRAPIPRPINAAEVLHTQAELFDHLRRPR